MTKIIIEFDNTYEKLPDQFYRKVELDPAPRPEYVYLNQDLAEDLGLDYELLKEEGLEIFSGSKFPDQASQIAQAYAGHQFGYFTMLGDGRAVLVGEILDPEGKRFDIQLKGSGRTPYSRGGDGKATLKYMLKEYLFSEAMYHLGAPTSRSLAVVKTGEAVMRTNYEEGAILTRVASSHIRVGTFQFAYSSQDEETLKALADYSIKRHYPELEDSDNKYLEFYDSVLKVQAQTVAKWMALGFIHGVMNTDNTSISGETFDYGPCAFIDEYDLSTVYSSIDNRGRYAFGKQPQILSWNLARFGESLLPIVGPDKRGNLEKLTEKLQNFSKYYEDAYYKEMAGKFGIFILGDEDIQLIDKFLSLLEKYQLDYTNSFTDLTLGDFSNDIYKNEDFNQWIEIWQRRISKQGKSEDQVRDLMGKSNPYIIARNYWVQKSLDQAVAGDFSLLDEFLLALKTPYDRNENAEKFTTYPKDMDYITYCGT